MPLRELLLAPLLLPVLLLMLDVTLAKSLLEVLPVRLPLPVLLMTFLLDPDEEFSPTALLLLPDALPGVAVLAVALPRS